MSSYPRLTRANLRSLVREITGILSADVITDARINEWLNEALYDINAIGDNLGVNWHQGASPYGPILVQDVTNTGVYYRFPGWEWDNTTQFPTGVKDNLYMESDSDTAPWNNGHFDTVLAYKVIARVFKQIADDTARATEYETKYLELANTLLRDKFLSHNTRFINEYDTGNSGANAFISLYLKTLMFLGELVTIDSALEIANNVRYAVTNEYWELGQAYKWPFSTSTYNGLFSFAPFVDIFAYGAGARLAGERNMPEMVIKSLQENYNTRLEALKTKYLTPTYLSTKPYSVATIRAQVRGLLNEHTGNLSDAMIDTFIDDAYMQIVNERSWNFLERSSIFPVYPGLYQYPILTENFGYTPVRRVLNVYKVTGPQGMSAYDAFGDSKNVETVNRIPTTIDGQLDSSKYRYDIRTAPVNVMIDDELFTVMAGEIMLSPIPTEDFFLKVRYIAEPLSLVNGGQVLFDVQFIRVLVYAAALNVISFTQFGDKKLIQMYAKQVEDIKAQMYRYYELDASTDAFSLGETGLSIPKYVPHFRVD